jgi:hypothetical protein
MCVEFESAQWRCLRGLGRGAWEFGGLVEVLKEFGVW